MELSDKNVLRIDLGDVPDDIYCTRLIWYNIHGIMNMVFELIEYDAVLRFSRCDREGSLISASA